MVHCHPRGHRGKEWDPIARVGKSRVNEPKGETKINKKKKRMSIGRRGGRKISRAWRQKKNRQKNWK